MNLCLIELADDNQLLINFGSDDYVLEVVNKKLIIKRNTSLQDFTIIHYKNGEPSKEIKTQRIEIFQ